MADFGASYAEMEQVASSLSQARDDIQGQLDTLKGQVDTLLGEDFKTQHASGKFGEGYGELTTGLKTAVDGINDMSESLLGMMRADPGSGSAARRRLKPAGARLSGVGAAPKDWPPHHSMERFH